MTGTRLTALPPDADDLSASVDAMRRILRRLRIIARQGEQSTGLSPAQAFVLTVIVRRPGMSVSQVAAATMTDRSSAAAVIDRLADKGFVARSQAEEDRRRAVITATAAGRRALKKTSPAPTLVLIGAIRRLAQPDRRALTRGLRALTRTMGIAAEPPGMLFEEARPGRRRA